MARRIYVEMYRASAMAESIIDMVYRKYHISSKLAAAGDCDTA